MKVLIGPFPKGKSNKERKVNIRIDDFDSWNVDHTISLIAVPLLKQLQKTKHGAGAIDDEDVPEKLRSTSAPPLSVREQETGGIDKLWFKRYEWVLDEMIWALNEIAENYPGEDKFLRPAGNARGFQRNQYKAYHDRVQNGTRLFGKYFQTLWD